MTQEVKVCLNNEMGRLEELHGKESKLWHEVKSRYEAHATSNTSKISNLKTTIQEMRTRTEMNTANIKVLLATNQEVFTHQLKEALDRGWTTWARQAVKLHTYRAD